MKVVFISKLGKNLGNEKKKKRLPYETAA